MADPDTVIVIVFVAKIFWCTLFCLASDSEPPGLLRSATYSRFARRLGARSAVTANNVQSHSLRVC